MKPKNILITEYENGKAMQQIAKDLKISYWTVREIIKKAGILRSHSEAGKIMQNHTQFQKGQHPWNKGISPSSKIRKKLSTALKGNHTSPETEFKRINGNGDRSFAQKYGDPFKKCEECGETFEEHRKEVHHIDGNIHNNSPENLNVTCSKCHGKTKLFPKGTLWQKTHKIFKGGIPKMKIKQKIEVKI
jgi:hypothetical protein